MLCLIPVYLAIGVLNIVANKHNYNIHLYRDVDPNYDIRVRRDTNIDDTKHNDATEVIILNFLIESFKDITSSPNVMIEDQDTLESDEYGPTANNGENHNGNIIKKPMNAYELIKRGETTHSRVARHVRNDGTYSTYNYNGIYDTKTPLYGKNSAIYSYYNNNGVYLAKPGIYNSNSGIKTYNNNNNNNNNNGVYETITAAYPSNDGIIYRNNNHNGVYDGNSGVYNNNNNNGVYAANSGVYSNNNNNGLHDTKTAVYGSSSGVYDTKTTVYDSNTRIYDSNNRIYESNSGTYNNENNDSLPESDMDMEISTEMNIQIGCIFFCGRNRCPKGKELVAGYCVSEHRRMRKRT